MNPFKSFLNHDIIEANKKTGIPNGFYPVRIVDYKEISKNHIRFVFAISEGLYRGNLLSFEIDFEEEVVDEIKEGYKEILARLYLAINHYFEDNLLFRELNINDLINLELVVEVNLHSEILDFYKMTSLNEITKNNFLIRLDDLDKLLTGRC